MCTLTWRRGDPGGLEVFFNRDELKTRPIASPPQIFKVNGVKFMSPRDPRGGGTWMLVNEFGIVVCLLNNWKSGGESQVKTRKSRGRLVWSMAGIRNLADLENRLEDLEDYPAFHLAVFGPEGENCWEWDGVKLGERIPLMPMTSSSFCFEQVKAAREAVFEGGLRGAAYHRSVGQASSAHTVRMCRPDAQTWSRSTVWVGETITWEYLAEQPDLSGPPYRTLIEMPRR